MTNKLSITEMKSELRDFYVGLFVTTFEPDSKEIPACSVKTQR